MDAYPIALAGVNPAKVGNVEQHPYFISFDGPDLNEDSAWTFDNQMAWSASNARTLIEAIEDVLAKKPLEGWKTIGPHSWLYGLTAGLPRLHEEWENLASGQSILSHKRLWMVGSNGSVAIDGERFPTAHDAMIVWIYRIFEAWRISLQNHGLQLDYIESTGFWGEVGEQEKKGPDIIGAAAEFVALTASLLAIDLNKLLDSMLLETGRAMAIISFLPRKPVLKLKVKSESVRPKSASETHRESILDAMNELQAYSEDQSKSSARIIMRSHGADFKIASLKHTFADLVHRGLIRSIPGQGGGYWLTAEGIVDVKAR